MRDFSRTHVSIAPAEYGSWNEARAELLRERKRPLKAQLEQELSAAADATESKEIRQAFALKEVQMEHEVDHKPLEVHLSLGVSYNFLAK